MRKLTRTTMVYAPNYPAGGEAGKCFEFRTVSKARNKALTLGIESRLVFWQNEKYDGFTEDIELELTDRGFKKRIWTGKNTIENNVQN